MSKQDKSAWDRTIEPIVVWCDAHRGARNRIAELMTRTSRPRRVYAKQYIGQWLHPDSAKRTVPGAGAAILLLLACETVAHRAVALPLARF